MMASNTTSLLSSLDQLMPRCHIRIFVAFAVDDHHKAITKPQKGLNLTASCLPYIRGHVCKVPAERNQLAISWSDNDPAHQLRESSVQGSDMPSLKDLKKSHGALHHFTATMAPVPVSPDHLDPETKAPIIAANYTRIEGGSIPSLAVHHNVMDGTGVGLLVKL
jgi:hypothetical protein